MLQNKQHAQEGPHTRCALLAGVGFKAARFGASTCTASATRRFFLRTRGAGGGAGGAAPVSLSAPAHAVYTVIQSKLSQVAEQGMLGAQQMHNAHRASLLLTLGGLPAEPVTIRCAAGAERFKSGTQTLEKTFDTGRGVLQARAR